jgi:hypothetical protein
VDLRVVRNSNRDFRRRRDPNERTAGDLADAVARKGMDFAWPVPRPAVGEAPTAPASRVGLVVTTNEVAGHRIVALHGDVIGVTAIATSIVSSWLVGLSAIAGGETTTLSKLLLDARQAARARMWMAPSGSGPTPSLRPARTATSCAT